MNLQNLIFNYLLVRIKENTEHGHDNHTMHSTHIEQTLIGILE
jgi:hypothetical protein